MQPAAQEQRPLGELFSELAQETRTLIKQEVQLARCELVMKSRDAAGDVAWIAGGIVLATGGCLALLAALILALAIVLPLWLSALLVGWAFAGVGAVVAWHGVDMLKRIDPAPQQTLQTLKEDRRWLSQQLSQ